MWIGTESRAPCWKSGLRLSDELGIFLFDRCCSYFPLSHGWSLFFNYSCALDPVMAWVDNSLVNVHIVCLSVRQPAPEPSILCHTKHIWLLPTVLSRSHLSDYQRPALTSYLPFSALSDLSWPALCGCIWLPVTALPSSPAYTCPDPHLHIFPHALLHILFCPPTSFICSPTPRSALLVRPVNSIFNMCPCPRA